MTYKVNASAAHPSNLLAAELEAGDTNSACHDYSGGVQPNNKHVMRNPKVVLLLWDSYYSSNPDAVTLAEKLVNDLLTGTFMNGLAQYGVGRGMLIKTLLIDTNVFPAPDTWDTKGTSDADQIKSWVKDGVIFPEPSVNNTDLLYFLFLPRSTKLTNGKRSDGTVITDVGGWHSYGKVIDSQSQDNDLFWGLVRTDNADSTTEKTFIQSLGGIVSHELNEAFSNRDQQGFTGGGCEIGDICELKDTYDYSGDWKVQQYFSQWDNSCIHGDAPVSLRKFLGAISFDINQGLRSLGTSVINTQFIASKM